MKTETQSSPISQRQKTIWYLIFAQALLAMLGSLYFSNFGDPVANIFQEHNFFISLGFEPCHLCWWARILMYPLVGISLVGILKNDKRFTNYVLMLSLPGIFLEIYHYALQKLPLGIPEGCSIGNPCNAMEVNYLGFITIPFLCLIAFTVITVLALINIKMNAAEK